MDGCLGKTLLIITATVAIFASYPFVKKFLSDQAQDKLNQLETKGTITGRILKEIGETKVDKIKEEINQELNPENPNKNPSNDNSKN